MTNRDTQFETFAQLLIQDIDGQVGSVIAWCGEHDIDDEEKINQELYSRWQTLIARRGYDLVQHTIGHSLEYLDECGIELSGGMGTRIAPSIPDMTAWPEESK